VDKIDIYRQGGVLTNFTYVGTTDNSSTPFIDTLADLAAVNNPQLEFDNFEPFPSIDLPGKEGLMWRREQSPDMTVTWLAAITSISGGFPERSSLLVSLWCCLYVLQPPSSNTVLTVVLDPSMPVPSPSTG